MPEEICAPYHSAVTRGYILDRAVEEMDIGINVFHFSYAKKARLA